MKALKSRRWYPMWIPTLAIALATGACEGPTGPQGDQGPQGAQGPQGEQGPEGTANVIYSEWTAFDVANWSEAQSEYGQMRREYPIDVPELDAEILATGTVQVYARVPGTLGDKVFPLPWIYGLTKGIAQVLGFELEPATIIINFHDLVDDSVDPGTFGSGAEYRYVIIPGGTTAAPVQGADYHTLMDQWGIDP